MNSSKIVGSHISNSDMPVANLYNNDLTGEKVSEKTLKDTILYKKLYHLVNEVTGSVNVSFYNWNC